MSPDELSQERVTLVVDAANVVGSRPDGWWRDRAAATLRLLERLTPLVGAGETGPAPTGPGGRPIAIERVVVVVEGQARGVPSPPGITLVRAEADGDTAVVEAARQVVAEAGVPLVVTADRGLRGRLPAGTQVAGPSWLLGMDAGPAPR